MKKTIMKRTVVKWGTVGEMGEALKNMLLIYSQTQGNLFSQCSNKILAQREQQNNLETLEECTFISFYPSKNLKSHIKFGK